MPKAAVLILSTIAIDMLIMSAVVGIAFFVILRHLHWNVGARAVVPTLLAVFAFLDLFWWPALASTSATITIHNSDLAAFLRIGPDSPVESLIGFGLVDLLGYFIQAGVALWVSYKLRLVVSEGAA
jgi:hypothetical protein